MPKKPKSITLPALQRLARKTADWVEDRSVPAGDGRLLPVAYHTILQQRLRKVLDAFNQLFLTKRKRLAKIPEVIADYWALRDQLGLNMERALPRYRDEKGSLKVYPTVPVPCVDRLAHDRQAMEALVQTLRRIGGGKTTQGMRKLVTKYTEHEAVAKLLEWFPQLARRRRTRGGSRKRAKRQRQRRTTPTHEMMKAHELHKSGFSLRAVRDALKTEYGEKAPKSPTTVGEWIKIADAYVDPKARSVRAHHRLPQNRRGQADIVDN